MLSYNHCKPNGIPLRTYSIVPFTYLAQNRHDDGRMSALNAKGAHTRTSLARESASGSLALEPGSDIFHHTRTTLLVHFSIQNEFIEASCSSSDNTR